MYFFTNSLLSPRTHSNGVGWSYTCLEVIKEVIKMSIIFPILVLQSIYNNNVEIANYSHNSESWFYEPVHMFDVFLPLFLCVCCHNSLSLSLCKLSGPLCVCSPNCVLDVFPHVLNWVQVAKNSYYMNILITVTYDYQFLPVIWG